MKGVWYEVRTITNNRTEKWGHDNVTGISQNPSYASVLFHKESSLIQSHTDRMEY